MNILLVEDNPTDAKLLTAVLQLGGHHVLGKRTAEQALEEIKSSYFPELILLDLKLPGMNGLELARLLKADPATQHIPIVGITAELESFSRQESLDAGCDAYVSKPVDTRTLNAQISRAGAL